LDTGARTSHEEFLSLDGSYSRIDVVQDVIGDGRNGEDCDGHGTHVTALAAGRKYGVAKNASVHIVRVLDCEGYVVKVHACRTTFSNDPRSVESWQANSHPFIFSSEFVESVAGDAFCVGCDFVVCRYGADPDIIQAMAWVKNNALRPATMSLALGGEISMTLDLAVAALVSLSPSRTADPTR
jgi:hypothetical protein